MDVAYEETEKLLERLERKVGRVYRRAVRESKKSLNDYLAAFKKQDEKMRKLLESGELTEKDYVSWRKSEMLRGKHFQETLNTLSEDYVNADKIAMSLVREYMPEVYALNHNFAAFEIEKGSLIDTTFTLYDRQTVERLLKDNPQLLPMPRPDIPKDRRWNRRKIKEEITQGILQGEPIDKIARRLQNVADMDYAAAVRNARTATTGAQNAGRVDSYKRAQEMGIDIMQEWMATLDNHTRHSHALLDGERINVGGTFSNGCKYPGDPNGPSDEIYNCRCTLVAFLTGFNFSSGERDSKLGKMSYDEWKSSHKR